MRLDSLPSHSLYLVIGALLLGVFTTRASAQESTPHDAAEVAPADTQQGGDEPSCIPACRSGYVCVQGQCVSACNPACPADQICRDGECFLAAATPASQPVDAAGPAPAAPSEAAPGEPMTLEPAEGSETGLPQSWVVAAKAGVLFGGEIYVSDVGDLDMDAGPLFVASAEKIVAPSFSVGGQFLIASPSVLDESFTLVNLGAIFKLRLQAGSVSINPGAVLAYQIIDHDDVGDAINGFSPGALVEVLVPLGKTVSGVAEVGFISQPSGGNSDYEVTFGPKFYLSAGVAFGR
jgi:hypothetical protein